MRRAPIPPRAAPRRRPAACFASPAMPRAPRTPARPVRERMSRNIWCALLSRTTHRQRFVLWRLTVRRLRELRCLWGGWKWEAWLTASARREEVFQAAVQDMLARLRQPPPPPPPALGP